MLYQMLHPGVVWAMAWMPLGLWGIDQAVEQRNWRPLWKVAAASAFSFLAGYPAAWVVYGAIVIVYGLASRAHWRAALGVLLAVAASLPLIAVQLLPAMEARSLMLLEPKYGAGAYGWKLLLAYFVPNWFDFNPGHPTDYEPGSLYLYLGLPAVFAVAWAFWRHRLRPYVQALVVLGAALLLANPPELLIKLVERIPPLSYTMQPFNFYAGVSAMAALFAATAVGDFLSRPSKFRLPRALEVFAVAGMAAWFGRQLWHSERSGVFRSGMGSIAEVAVAAVLFALVLRMVRDASGRRRAWLATGLLLAAGIDYQVFGACRWFNAQPGDVDDEHPPYGIGGVDDTAYRVMRANRHYRVITGGPIGPAATDYRHWGLVTPEGFDPFLPLQYKQTVEQWTPFLTNRLFDVDLNNDSMLQAFGVRYIVVREGVEEDVMMASSPRFRRIGRAQVFAHVYEYLHALPPYGWADGSGSAEPTGWMPERRELRVRSERGGRFMLVEQFFPGWTATVDGRPVEIERCGRAFQAVSVPPGEHQVSFEFRPRTLRLGAIVSVLAWAGLALVAFTRRERNAQPA
jgi:hypothetical protein